MAWLQEGIDPLRTADQNSDLFAYYHECLRNKHQLYTDDLTYIIPVSIDSHDRISNLRLCILWLLQNTTAKIIVYLADDPSDIAKMTGYVQSDILEDVLRSADGTLTDVSDADIVGEDASEMITNFLVMNILTSPFVPPVIPNSRNIHEVTQIMNSSYDPDKNELEIISEYRKLAVSRMSVFFESKPATEPFHKTKYFNRMLSKVTTPFVCAHDADILYPVTNIRRSMSILRTAQAEMVLPFGHTSRGEGLVKVHAVDMPVEKKYAIITSALTGDFSAIHKEGYHHEVGAGYGGSAFVNTAAYKAAGGENELLVSWGPEDVERYCRFAKLGFRIARIDECRMYHPEHVRGIDSGREHSRFAANEKMWNEQQKMSRQQLAALMENTTGKAYGWTIMYGPNSGE